MDYINKLSCICKKASTNRYLYVDVKMFTRENKYTISVAKLYIKKVVNILK